MRFRDFDLNLLVYLDALIAEKSVSRAAARVSITQPAMSEALSRMRAHFKDELLVSVAGRNMVLTPLAQALAGPVRAILLQAQSVTAATSDFIPEESARRFSIVASDYVFDVLLKGVIVRLSREAPGVRIEMKRVEANARQHIRRADVDLLIMPKQFISEELPCEQLFEDRIVCVVWNRNKLVGRKVTLEQYLELAHVRRGIDGELTEWDRWFGSRYGDTRKVEAVVPEFGMALKAVEGTNLITIAHLRHARLYARQFSLRIVTPPVDFPPFSEYLQWHPHQSGDPGLVWLRNLIKSVAAEP